MWADFTIIFAAASTVGEGAYKFWMCVTFFDSGEKRCAESTKKVMKGLAPDGDDNRRHREA
jgi:hypothetical protein